MKPREPATRWLPSLLLVVSVSSPVDMAAAAERPRLFVLTDIGADPDDTQTLVRLLVYSNEIDIEGLAATTSMPQRTRVHPEMIREVLDAYGNVRANLCLHDPGYPTESALETLVTEGPAKYGMTGVGRLQDSSASRALVRALQKTDDRPLWVTAWGGSNVLAQALWTIREAMSPDEASRLQAKLRVYTISDQDDSGPWIRKEFRDVFCIVTPGGWGRATWTAMAKTIEGADNESVTASWLAQNIQQGHSKANHPPVASIAGPEEFTVHPGQTFNLDASPSSDPDGDSLSFQWYQYPEAGSFDETISFQGKASNLRTIHDLIAPRVSKPKTAHIILEVTDNGTPPLTRYRRVIVEFVP